jgi:Zn finger protein HypA/HybF involved in hydrogenase expression
MTDPIRIECVSCGEPFTEGQQRADCPHEHTTSFTRGAMQALRELLNREDAQR